MCAGEMHGQDDDGCDVDVGDVGSRSCVAAFQAAS
jgi:hypothetical protein